MPRFGSTTRPIYRGRVRCPLRGDVDVEECYGCRWARRVDLPASRIACRPPRPPVLVSTQPPTAR